MANKLQDYFPLIRTRGEVLDEIRSKDNLRDMYEKWRPKQQEEFLDFCTGVRGVKILYDSFFKEIMSPESAPERLNELLSELLGKEVKIVQVLPNDSARIADESSLLVMDIVVSLRDGSLANLEMQKIGYAFPGQRSACYCADLLLRQYKRVRGEKKEGVFSYRDIQTVYNIVLFEKSTREFHEHPEDYIHRSRQRFDTGLHVNLLQEFIFVPLDIFRKNTQNKSVDSELEAWLTFLSFDSPEKIVQLIEKYPRFKEMYDEVYEICLNTERVMGMFSKELQELDRNTVQYMIDEMQEEINKQSETIDTLKRKVEEQKKLLEKSGVFADSI
ncbi:PD-(D/E)XK nuclease family transposase [Diplocloster hominis]|uniref:PD-(D/E)XK nuclease family transposase n=1 Tax=Diplocloster hominis TaxID=3079010 RepID=UPI0031BA31C1